MPFPKKLLCLLSFLLFTPACFASGHLPSYEGLEGLLFIFLVFAVIAVAAPVVSIISYSSGSKKLNAVAWILAVASFVLSAVLAATEFGSMSAVLPTVSFACLLGRMQKRAAGNRFLAIYIIKAAMVLIAVDAVMSVLPLFLRIGAMAGLPGMLFMLLLENGVLGWLMYLLVKQIPGREIATPRTQQIIYWTALAGLGAFAGNLFYFGMRMRFGNDFFLSLSATLFRSPFSNLLVRGACWVVIGLIVNALHKPRKMGVNEEQ